MNCTAYGFLGHSVKEDCDTITMPLKGVSNGETKKIHPEFKTELVLEVLSGAIFQAEVCRRYNLNENQLSQWKQQRVPYHIELRSPSKRE